MIRNSIRHAVTPSRLALVAVATVLVAATTAGAAGQTAVRLSAEEPLSVSETTTVDVVVDDADGGVGAYNVTVTVADPGTARIVDVTLHGDPSAETSEVEVAADGSSATAIAALADTDDSGSVTVASVTLRGDEAGSTDLDLTVTALGDEQGYSYTTTAEDTDLTVVGADGDSGNDGDSGDDDSGNDGDAGDDDAGGDNSGEGGDGDDGSTAEDDSPTENADGNTESETTATADGADGTDRRTPSATPTATRPTERPATPTEETASSVAPDPLGSPTDGTDVFVPGFGALTALLALIAAALALRHRE